MQHDPLQPHALQPEPSAEPEGLRVVQWEAVQMSDIEIQVIPPGPWICPNQRGAEPCDCSDCSRPYIKCEIDDKAAYIAAERGERVRFKQSSCLGGGGSMEAATLSIADLPKVLRP